jgi:energy-converting hydrogenase Eha subunit A
MRVTGLVLVLVGLLAGVICVVVLVQPSDPNQQAPMTNDGQVQRPTPVLPLALCGLAVVVGGAMYMYGGRSYNVINDPRVRS